MKTILVLTPRFPYPVIGGDRLRIYQICKELSKNYKVRLLSLCENEEEMSFSVQDDVFYSIDRVLLPKWQSYLNCLIALPTVKPLQVAYYQSKIFKGKVEELLVQCDACLAHLVRTSNYLLETSTPKVLEMTDAISMNYGRVAITKSSGFKNLVYTVEQKRLKAYEQAIAEQFDTSLLVSQVDKDYLFLPETDVYSKVLVCSNGVDTNLLSYQFNPASKQLVFIGNLYSVQNLDAALWFSKNVMPLLRLHGDFSFKIIGRIKDKDRGQFTSLEGIEVTGAVESIIDESRGALAGICSVRLGAGVQNKILEYMALGLPTITSEIGLEGLEAIPDKELLTANNENEYIDAIMSLVNSPELTRSLSENGRSYVVNNHSWESRLSPVLSSFKKLLD